ncbi:MAG: SDR family oxidoreductase [bacterium]|nr:SDR family oxidoreductase [bacterium]
MNALILGATKGLGKEITFECLNRGLKTIELGSSIDKNTIKENREFIHCDLLSTESVNDTIQKLNNIETIDYFFWVAGRILKGKFSDYNIQEIFDTIDVNFRNAIPLIHYVWNRMQHSKRKSKFIAIASSAGKKAKPEESIYVATKFAQVGFVRSLGMATENKVKVSLILPGGMKTQLWDNFPTKDYNSFNAPSKVTKKIFNLINEQESKYDEFEIPRGSV